jgi:hypothetical protein
MKDFDLAAELTDRVAAALRDAGASRQLMMLTEHGWRTRPVD